MKSTAWPLGGLSAVALATALLLTGCVSDDADGSATDVPAPESASAAPQTPASTEPSTAAATATTSTTASPSTGQPAEELADDLPELLTPAVENSTIEISTIEQSEEVAAVSLVAVTSATPEEVLKHYRKLLTDRGFEALGPDSIDGTMSQTFSRESGLETVTISAIEHAGETTYTLGAHLLAASVG